MVSVRLDCNKGTVAFLPKPDVCGAASIYGVRSEDPQVPLSQQFASNRQGRFETSNGIDEMFRRGTTVVHEGEVGIRWKPLQFILFLNNAGSHVTSFAMRACRRGIVKMEKRAGVDEGSRRDAKEEVLGGDYYRAFKTEDGVPSVFILAAESRLDVFISFLFP